MAKVTEEIKNNDATILNEEIQSGELSDFYGIVKEIQTKNNYYAIQFPHGVKVQAFKQEFIDILKNFSSGDIVKGHTFVTRSTGKNPDRFGHFKVFANFVLDTGGTIELAKS